jgi:hypothetical protein
MDEQTVVIIDLDKTALGARGRNDHIIDQVRVEAVHLTVRDLLRDSFDPDEFQSAYTQINQPEFHEFTGDNQDYLAYICLILGVGLFELKPFIADIRAGRLKSFEDFITSVNRQGNMLPADLQVIHDEIYRLVQRGDPTPFKDFRYKEYEVTTHKMGCLNDDVPTDELLAGEIVITQEVREFALRWQAHGALIFGLSDKPDEASIPNDNQWAQGNRAIHQVETHAVGG